MRELSSNETLSRLQDSIYGRIEDLATKNRLRLCLREELYVECDRRKYTPKYVAELMARANVPRFLSSINCRSAW